MSFTSSQNFLICFFLSFMIVIGLSALSVKKLCLFMFSIFKRYSWILSSSSKRLSIWQTRALLTPNLSPTWVFDTIDGSLSTSAYFKASSRGEGLRITGLASLSSFLVILLSALRLYGKSPAIITSCYLMNCI